MFMIGQKVVCFVDFSHSRRYGIAVPAKEHIYIVRDLINIGREPGLRLFEITNRPMKHSNWPQLIEPAFSISGFRPIIEHKTDISIFTEMLTGSSKTKSYQPSSLRDKPL